MALRGLGIAITLFFIAMNVVLWRSEVLARSDGGTPVPVASVWRKMVAAPDLSALEIRHHGRAAGHCRWMANVVEAVPVVVTNEADEALEGMIRQPINYTIDFNGNWLHDDHTPIRFHSDLKLSTNYAWQEFNVRIQVKPMQWEVRGNAAAREIRLITTEDGRSHEHVIPFDRLRDPQALLREFGGPMLPVTLAAMGVPLRFDQGGEAASRAFKVESTRDWMQFGRTRLRVYKVRAVLFGRFTAQAFISPVGEILRVELPDRLVLVNDALATAEP